MSKTCVCCQRGPAYNDYKHRFDFFDLRREWPRQVFLSHKQSNSAGVGILFSIAFSPQSVELHHVMAGHVFMVKALHENVKMVYLCVYAPVLSPKRMFFSNALCDVTGGVSDEYVFLGGDFNCTVSGLGKMGDSDAGRERS